MGAAATKPSLADASRSLLRERTLDAVGELAVERPWSRVTMADVAERAGVSRQTLYNAFGSQSELAQAYVMREAERFVAAVEGVVRAHPDEPRAALGGAIELFLSAAETHPLIRAVVAGTGGEELLPLVTTRGGPLVDEVTGRLGAVILETWPGLAREDAQLVADCVVRLAISHAALPGGTPKETADALARVLGPYLDELLASLPG